MNKLTSLAAGMVLAFGLATGAKAQDLPAPPAQGVSKMVDRIKASGVLRVGVMNNHPWLTQNTSGGGENWSGPAWLLSKILAKELGVKVQEIPVSNETKVPALAAGQIDLSISALGVTPARLEVADFIVYSKNSTCMIGRKDNPRFAEAKTVDDLNKPDVDLVYIIGSPDEPYLRKRFPNAKVRGVTAHVDEVVAGHADSTPYNRVSALRLKHRLPEIIVLPSEDDCQNSPEQSTQVGIGMDKNNPEFLEWARSVVSVVQADLDAEEARVIAEMK